jgi:hypothetical protein
VNQDLRRVLLNINNSGFGCLLSFILVAFLLGSVGLGWVINGFLILIALLLISPILLFWGVSWWLKRNLVEDKCPVCGYQFTGFNKVQCRCPSCGELLNSDHGHFQRITPAGTIDVDAIEVPTKTLED